MYRIYKTGDFPFTEWDHSGSIQYQPGPINFRGIWNLLDNSYKEATFDKDGVLKIEKVIAGLGKEDIQVSYNESDSTILIKCSSDPTYGEKESTYTLSKPIDPKSLKASLSNGVLTVTCKAKSNSYQIKIE